MIRIKYYLLFGLGLVFFNSCMTFLAMTLQYESLQSENSILENLQVVFLTLATIGYLTFTLDPPNERLINSAIALLCFSFIMRELDTEHLNLPQILIAVSSGAGRKLLLGFLWISLFLYSYATIKNKLSFIEKFVKSYRFVILAAALLFLIIGGVMDRQIFDISHSILFEELAETNAYFVIALPVFYKTAQWVHKSLFGFLS